MFDKKIFLAITITVISFTNRLCSQDEDSLLLLKISEIEIDINVESEISDSLFENSMELFDTYETEDENYDYEGQGHSSGLICNYLRNRLSYKVVYQIYDFNLKQIVFIGNTIFFNKPERINYLQFSA